MLFILWFKTLQSSRYWMSDLTHHTSVDCREGAVTASYELERAPENFLACSSATYMVGRSGEVAPLDSIYLSLWLIIRYLALTQLTRVGKA